MSTVDVFGASLAESAKGSTLAENNAALLRNRDGVVLTRKTILKTDQNLRQIKQLECQLVGAPNFRKCPFSIYGVAQPSLTGLHSVLQYLRVTGGADNQSPTPSALKCPPDVANNGSSNCENSKSNTGNHVYWISMREEPFIYINDQPYVIRDLDNPFENIHIYSGVSASRLEAIEEKLANDVRAEAAKYGGIILVHVEDEKENIMPSFIAAIKVKTPRQIFNSLATKYNDNMLSYFRVPISSHQLPNESFVDEFVQIIREIPANQPLVFSCGMGIGRTTVGMIIGYIIRKILFSPREKVLFPAKKDWIKESLEKRKNFIRLIYVLEKGFQGTDTFRSTIEYALQKPDVMDSLEESVKGNYSSILDLCRVLENGVACKNLLDEAVDACDQVVNLRENILFYRIKQCISTPEDDSNLSVALNYMGRYFNLIAFSSYCVESDSKFLTKFCDWIKERNEILTIFNRIRSKGLALETFHPVSNLNELTRQLSEKLRIPGPKKGIDIADYAIKHRTGSVLTQYMILKVDSYKECPEFQFRSVENVSAMSQPSINGLISIAAQLTSTESSIVWINLREEPIIYLNGSSYVLREYSNSSRNIKILSGITPNRIEALEERLKNDIQNELLAYEGKLLIHSEGLDGAIVASWIQIESALTPKEVSKMPELNGRITYYRVPITAEDSPDYSNFDEILQIVRFEGHQKQFLVNCQMGRGRSTMGMIMLRQCIDFVRESRDSVCSSKSSPFYKSILSLMRLVQNGLEIKDRVDYFVEMFSQVIHITATIAESQMISVDPAQSNFERKRSQKKALRNLKRFFLLFTFEAYLDVLQSQKFSSTFKQWISSHLEILRLLAEMDKKRNLEYLLIPQNLMQPDKVLASHTPDLIEIINNRSGSVLAHRMILKHDHFLGCQKMNLKERIEGAPNFRQILINFDNRFVGFSVCGIGMPKKQAVYNTIERVGASNFIRWISFREEPVLFIKGDPYVLRFFQEPLSNIESTGIVRDRVESIENRLKIDVLNELKQYKGKILLQEEQVGGTQLGFSIVPVWVEAEPCDIQTSKDVYDEACKLYPSLKYVRIPITDEQAPLSSVFDELHELLLENRDSREPSDVIFNCQMGRGRTTTGMIIATIVEICRDVEHIIGIDLNSRPPSINGSPVKNSRNEEKRLLNGEYKIILHLMACLDHGKKSKTIADRAIDLCSHIQNLREAIYTEFKVVIPNLASEEKKNAKRHVGINYLMRYFSLIVFADYSLSFAARRTENGELNEANRHPTFSQWLAKRREIQNLQKDCKSYVVEF